MLTLNEIRNVNFRKANFGGYRAEDVEAFIDEVQLSYDTLLRENAELVKKLEVLAAKLEEYQGEEDSIRNALMNAQKVGDASLRDAKHKAEIILKDATIKAEKIVSNAQSEIHSEREIIERMQRDIAEFKAKLLRAYKEHLTMINSIPNEEILQPDTREMVDSVQMLDRRASEPEYDRPQGGDPRGARMQPSREFSELPSDIDSGFAPAPSYNAPVPAAPAAPQPFGSDSAVMREDVRKRPEPAPAAAPAPNAPVMPVERTDKRKGGFTVDIGGDDVPARPAPVAPPVPQSAPAAPQQSGGFMSRLPRFGGGQAPAPVPEDDFDMNGGAPQFTPGGQPQQPEEGGGMSPANLFKRRRPQ